MERRPSNANRITTKQQSIVIYVAKIVRGKVELRDSNGNYQCTIGSSGAVSANVQGNTVAVTYDNGKVILYTTKGAYLRTI